MKLKTGQKCAFGFGAFGKDIVYMLISSYLLYYYNVVLGMSSVFIGDRKSTRLNSSHSH